MKLRYRLMDGGIVMGDTALDIINAVKDSSYTSCGDTEAFLSELAERCKLYDNSVIRTDSPENAVADLESCGFLTKELSET